MRFLILLLSLAQLLIVIGVIWIAKKHHEAKVEKERERVEKIMGEQVRQRRLAFPLEDNGELNDNE